MATKYRQISLKHIFTDRRDMFRDDAPLNNFQIFVRHTI